MGGWRIYCKSVGSLHLLKASKHFFRMHQHFFELLTIWHFIDSLLINKAFVLNFLIVSIVSMSRRFGTTTDKSGWASILLWVYKLPKVFSFQNHLKISREPNVTPLIPFFFSFAMLFSRHVGLIGNSTKILYAGKKKDHVNNLW
jgi:hypothetical protein